MATNFGTKIAITGFMRTITTRQLVMGGGFEWSADRLQILPILCTYGTFHGNHFLAFCIWGAHWHHLANTTEPSVCCGDAALRHISLTTCLQAIDIKRSLLVPVA